MMYMEPEADQLFCLGDIDWQVNDGGPLGRSAGFIPVGRLITMVH